MTDNDPPTVAVCQWCFDSEANADDPLDICEECKEKHRIPPTMVRWSE